MHNQELVQSDPQASEERQIAQVDQRTYEQGSNGFWRVQEASCRVNIAQGGMFGANRAPCGGRGVLHVAGRAYKQAKA